MPRRSVSRPFVAALTAATLLGAGLVAAPPALAAAGPGAPVVIDEVYGGGGNAGATITRDYVELYNPTTEPVDLSLWSVQYASAAGTSFQVTPLVGVIEPGGSFLVGQASGAGGSVVPLTDVSGSIPMSGSSGVVALVSDQTALTACGTTCATLPQVVDLVGYGSTQNAAGGQPAPALSNTTSASRDAAHTNTGVNGADFTAGAPAPSYSGGSALPPVQVEATPATIAEIQGTGAASPLAGALVVTSGVVTATYPTGGYNGYVIQTEGTGGPIDLATHTASDAVFVYSPSTMASVAIGDHVAVTGAVSEYFGLTEITVADAAGLEFLADPAEPIVPIPLTWPGDDAQRETVESMLVQPQGEYTVSNTYDTNRFGEVGLALGSEPLRQPTDAAIPGSAAANAIVLDNAARQVTLDDGASTDFLKTDEVTGALINGDLVPPYVSLTEPVVVEASVTFDAPVIVDYRFELWRFTPTTPVVGDGTGMDGVTFENLRTAAPEPVGGDISMASFNVLNYFTTLGAGGATCAAYSDRVGDGVTVRTGCDPRGAWDPDDLERQQQKIVAAINALDASVVGLMEIENSARLGEPADEATATLVAALNAAAGTTKWAYVPSSTELPDPAGQDVITNAIIYQPAEVVPAGPSRALGTESADDQAFGNAREPIAQVFRPAAGGERFLFVVNHFKSKGSAGPWPGDAEDPNGQGESNESRVRQATALRDWVADIQGDVTDVALAGDFNSYGQEDPLRILYDAGYSDAEQALGVDTSSYSFDGLSGSLDHILLSSGALERATGADIWNINSGESVALEYSRYNYHGTLFYAPDVYRSSDHDPVIVGLEAGVDERPTTTTKLAAVPPLHLNRILPATLIAYVDVEGRTRADGVVEFREGDTVIGTATVTRGIAIFTLPRVLSRGTHSYTAVFVPADGEAQRGSVSRTATVRTLF